MTDLKIFGEKLNLFSWSVWRLLYRFWNTLILWVKGNFFILGRLLDWLWNSIVLIIIFIKSRWSNLTSYCMLLNLWKVIIVAILWIILLLSLYILNTYPQTLIFGSHHSLPLNNICKIILNLNTWKRNMNILLFSFTRFWYFLQLIYSLFQFEIIYWIYL